MLKMSEADALDRVRMLLGSEATVQHCAWYLPEPKSFVHMCYAWCKGVICGIGDDWEDLVLDTADREQARVQHEYAVGG